MAKKALLNCVTYKVLSSFLKCPKTETGTFSFIITEQIAPICVPSLKTNNSDV